MHAIFKAADNKDLARLYSHVSTTAKPFFDHLGFRVVKEQQVEMRGELLSNYVMEKVL